MLRKIVTLTVAVCVATLLMSADALAWGCARGGGSWSHSGSGSRGGGSWNRSGSTSYTGRGGNTYTPIVPPARAATAVAIIMAALMVAVEGTTAGGSIREVSSLGTRPESIIPSTNLLASAPSLLAGNGANDQNAQPWPYVLGPWHISGRIWRGRGQSLGEVEEVGNS